MFSIFIKPSTIHLDCFTVRNDVAQFSPIKKSAHFAPEWFKNLPNEFFDDSSFYLGGTMKGCYGFLNQISTGFVMPLWSDLILEIGPENDLSYKWRFSDNESKLDVHPQFQRGNFLPQEKYQHFKLMSPWAFVCNVDIQWQCLQFPWSKTSMDEFMAVPGIVDYKYQTGTNINLMFEKTDKKRFVYLHHGHPIYQFIPLTEKKVKHKIQVISHEEMNKIKSSSAATTFIKKYATNKKLLCPFSK